MSRCTPVGQKFGRSARFDHSETFLCSALRKEIAKALIICLKKITPSIIPSSGSEIKDAVENCLGQAVHHDDSIYSNLLGLSIMAAVTTVHNKL